MDVIIGIKNNWPVFINMHTKIKIYFSVLF